MKSTIQWCHLPCRTLEVGSCPSSLRKIEWRWQMTSRTSGTLIGTFTSRHHVHYCNYNHRSALLQTQNNSSTVMQANLSPTSYSHNMFTKIVEPRVSWCICKVMHMHELRVMHKTATQGHWLTQAGTVSRSSKRDQTPVKASSCLSWLS